MAQHGDLKLRQAQKAFFTSLPRFEYLKTARERVRAEVSAFRLGESPEVFVTDAKRRALLGVLDRDDMWFAERNSLASAKKVFVKAEEAGRLKILALAGGQKELATLVKRWFSDPEAVITDWATDTLKRERKAFGLPEDETSWPPPKKLPTVWTATAYELARLFLVNRDARRIDPNDHPDQGHYI